MQTKLNVNGKPHAVDGEPRLTLVDCLRHTLGLTGTHVGCEHGVCGACTVIIDGKPARACLMLAVQADGANIETVESLADGETLAPLHDAGGWIIEDVKARLNIAADESFSRIDRPCR